MPWSAQRLAMWSSHLKAIVEGHADAVEPEALVELCVRLDSRNLQFPRISLLSCTVATAASKAGGSRRGEGRGENEADLSASAIASRI